VWELKRGFCITCFVVYGIERKKSETKNIFVGSGHTSWRLYGATTNRRLLDKTVLLDLKKPWSFLFSSEGDSGNSEKKGELRSPKNFDKNAENGVWWGILLKARTYFEEISSKD
jgi:hypothetical protein